MVTELSRNNQSLTQQEIQLQVIELLTSSGVACQTLVVNLLRKLQPQEMKEVILPPELDLQREVIIFGWGSVWLYGRLVDLCQAAPWVATYDLRSGKSIVVASRVAEVSPGDAVVIRQSAIPGPAILIGGPPSSGKSVLSHGLNRRLRALRPELKTHLFRANWDGEGNHTYETPNRDLAERLRKENNPKLQKQPDSPARIARFFLKKGEELPNVRRIIDLTLVDVGGKTDPDRLSVVQQCTHYIVISRTPEEVAGWHELCEPYLKPLAVIHSVQEQRLEVLRREPFLEAVAGPWARGEACEVPGVVLERVLEVLSP